MTPLTRTVSRAGVATVTGVTTAAALAGTGWLAGLAAADLHTEQARRQAGQHDAVAADPQPRHRGGKDLGSRTRPAVRVPVVLRQRPTRTRVTYQYVRSSGVGSGGSVTTQTVTPAQPAPAAPAAPQAAAPAPAPAPAATQPAPPPTSTPSTAS